MNYVPLAIPLHAALSSFNRKERNLLVRAIAGVEDGQIPLNEKFRRDLTKKLGLPVEISKNAWWATDYHISWLAGALAAYCEQGHDEKARVNTPGRVEGLDSQLIEGNQEDVDLVIADGANLIMIEAKAYGRWDETQLESKLCRLGLLIDEYQRTREDFASIPQIRFHVILMSPEQPLSDFSSLWPAWTHETAEAHWLELKVTGPVYSVSRCDSRSTIKSTETHWRIVKHQPRRTASKDTSAVPSQFEHRPHNRFYGKWSSATCPPTIKTLREIVRTNRQSLW